MSEQPDSYEKPEPQQMTKNVPPLAWIILVVLLGVFLVVGFQRRNVSHTPQGEPVPQTVQQPAYMPATPATGDAPATPGGVVINQPPR